MPARYDRSKQGSVVPGTVIEGPDAWYSKDYTGTDKHIFTLSDQHVQELDTAIKAALQDGVKVQEVTKERYPLPTLGPQLEEIQREVTWGRGFALVRGVPVERYSRLESVIAYRLIGLHWGKAVPQNKKGHIIGHIKDIGHDPANPNTRLYATNVGQPWHNDGPADLVSLLCLKPAKVGGSSSWASSVSVHNEMVKRAPELAKVAAEPAWYFDRKGEIPPGKLGYFLIPVFNYFKGYLSVNFSDNYFFLSQRHAEVPRLTELQLQAIKLFNELAASPELRMDYVLQPGDIQLLNNHTCLHFRSGFEDYDDVDQKRHLLRLWLTPAEDRPLPEYYADMMSNGVEAGVRGGIRTDGQEESIPLEAE